ncbi:MAG: 3D domain-containing protein [Candidatus Pacebacteria bacterium]|nr:3D domain-containing protein [Candidatus Paceibacterota bacterium]
MSRNTKNDPYSQRNPLNKLASIFLAGILITIPLSCDITTPENDNIVTEEKLLSDDFLTFHQNTLSPFRSANIDKAVMAVIVESDVTGSKIVYDIADTKNVSITGYSSTIDQTNSEPFITASGEWVRDGIVAANFLPFGSKIRIPQLFGDKIFTVQDRMNSRYTDRVDIWFSSRQQARNFGLKYATIEILEER